MQGARASTGQEEAVESERGCEPGRTLALLVGRGRRERSWRKPGTVRASPLEKRRQSDPLACPVATPPPTTAPSAPSSSVAPAIPSFSPPATMQIPFHSSRLTTACARSRPALVVQYKFLVVF